MKRGPGKTSGEPQNENSFLRSVEKFFGNKGSIPQTLQVQPTIQMQCVGQVQGAEGASAEGATAVTPEVTRPMGTLAGGVPGQLPVQKLATMPDPTRVGTFFYKMDCQERDGPPKKPSTTSALWAAQPQKPTGKREGQPQKPTGIWDGQPQKPTMSSTIWDGQPQKPLTSSTLQAGPPQKP